MKKHIIFSFVLIQCFLTISGQVTFDKGYIIDNSGMKIECLIKNYDRMSNPKTIQYKLSEESPIVSASIDSIQEFRVDNYSKYVRATVQIDRSPIEIEKLSLTRAPIWSEETLFLRELTCGEACLWVYTEYNSWFFYSLNGSQPEQLVYKRYTFQGTKGKNRIYENKSRIYENTEFRQQLSVYLQNENTKDVNLKNLKYREEALVKYFKRYNSALEENVQPDIKKPERELLNLKITGSVNYSRLFIGNQVMHREYDFGSKINWMGGLELEYFLPFNRNTTSILFAPTFEHYKNSIFYNDTFFGQPLPPLPINIDMISVRFPVGIRYGLYLNPDTKYFFEVYYNNPSLYINKNDGFPYIKQATLDIKESQHFILGGGFAYKNWQFELKYHTNCELFVTYYAWNTDYTKAVLSVSYKLFSIRK